MTAARTTAAPVSSSPAWIGNLSNLSAFAGALREYAKTLNAVAGNLDDKITKMTDAAHWQGDGGNAFRSAWEKDSNEARQTASMAASMGNILDQLTTRLTSIENGLRDDADTARKQGVEIGPQLQPLGAATSFADAYNTAKQQAEAAQTQAADEIMQLVKPWSLSAYLNFWGSAIVGAGGSSAILALDGVFGQGLITGALTSAGLATSTAVGVELAVPVVAFGVGDLALNLIEGHGLSSFADVGHSYEHLWDDTLGKLF